MPPGLALLAEVFHPTCNSICTISPADCHGVQKKEFLQDHKAGEQTCSLSLKKVLLFVGMFMVNVNLQLEEARSIGCLGSEGLKDSLG